MNFKPLLLAALLVAPLAFAQSAPTPAEGQSGSPQGGRSMNKHFMASDTNKDGAVSREEAQAAFERHFATLDGDKDGKVTPEEIKGAHVSARKMRADRFRAAFDASYKKADLNGDGMLSREEASTGMPRLGRAFDRFDGNKDGQLTTAEIQTVASKHGRRYGEHHGLRHHGHHRGPRT